MSKKDHKDVERRLLAEREELERQLGDLERQGLRVAQSELTGEASFDDEFADAGTATFERERDFSLAQNIRDLIDKIDQALQRLKAGTYGICESCGKPIGADRLRALPYASLCIDCKKREEGSH